MKGTILFLLVMTGTAIPVSAQISGFVNTSCSTCGGSGANGTEGNHAGPFFHISMGTTEYGQPAGDLTFSSMFPDASLFTPAALQFTSTRPDVFVVTNLDGSIQQVFAPQALADIVTGVNGYQINFYYSSQVAGTNSSGIYFFSGGPYVTWTITNPAPATINQIQISKTGSSYGLMNQWNYTYTNETWSFQPLGGLTQVNMSTVTNLGNNSYQIISTIQAPSNSTIVQQIKKTYKSFSWGVALVQISVGSDSAPQTTTYTYYDDAYHSGTPVPVTTITHPDGSWEYYASYNANGNPTVVHSSFGDVTLNYATNHSGGGARETDYTYDPGEAGVSSVDNGTISLNTARRVVQKLGGHEISRSYTVFPSVGVRWEIQCATAGALWDASGKLITTNQYFTSGPNQFALKAVIRPDGTITTYNYVTNGTYQTNITVTGQPDSSFSYVMDGTSNQVVLNQAGYPVFVATYDVLTGIALSQDTYGNFDNFGRPQQIVHLDNTTNTMQYACCGIDNSTDRDGVLTQYWYDGAKRQTAYIRVINSTGIFYTNVLDAAGHTLQSIRIGTDGSRITNSQAQYDLAGEVVAQTNGLGGATTSSRTNDSNTGALITATVNPDGGTATNFYYIDGSLKKVAGSAVHPVRYEYGVEQDGGVYRAYTKEIKLNAGGSDTSEWTKSYTDMLGRNYKTVYASVSGAPCSISYYNNQGQLWKQVDPDSVTNLYQYNAKGEQIYTAVDVNGNGSIDFSGTDRITWTTNDVATDNGANVRRTRTYVWLDGASSGTLVSIAETSTDGLKSWQTVYRDTGTAVISTNQIGYGASGARYMTNCAPDGSRAISAYSYGRLQSVTRKDSAGSQISQTTYSYDAHGRTSSTTDARNGATTYGYNNADIVNSVLTPNSGSGGSAQTTTTYYNQMLQATNIAQPDGTSVTNVYLLTGEVGQTSGSRTYPVGYSFDYAGRMKTMTNWTAFPSTGARVTTWNYHLYRGFLTNKMYPDTNGPFYAYTDAGRLKTRKWARNITTTYNYNAPGSLTNVSYSDSTPGVTNTYDRLGRLSSVFCNGMTGTMAYNLANELLMETNSGGTLNGLAVTNNYDAYLRRTAVALNTQSSTLTQFGYDNASRLQNVTNGNYKATYSYLANSPLVSQITFKQSSTTRMTTAKTYDYLNRLKQISSAPSASGQSVIEFNYSYNDANQRTTALLGDGSYWLYTYDKLGQVTGGKKYWSDGTRVAGQQFEYTDDDIGNRTQTKAGGDQSGANLRTANYTNNSLNQMTSRDAWGTNDVVGLATSGNSVTVNGNTAYRRGEYFWQAVGTNNTSAPSWFGITVSSGGNSVTGHVLYPKTPETFSYDVDGNLTNDLVWVYMWDAENRLIQMTNVAAVPTIAGRKLDFVYDYMGRRVQKMVSTNSGSAWIPVSTNRFVYDGWNLLAIINPQSSIIQSFMWGLDLSGSMQGAGGVGGLLMLNSVANGVHFYAYDGNGNVAGLVNASNGTIAAQYEYGPFGEVIRATGPIARVNPFRFSTQYQDDETDLLMYPHRPYSASQGRFLCKDPMAEQGGMNVYAFVDNDPVGSVDYLGLWDYKVHKDRTIQWAKALYYPPAAANAIGEADNAVDGFFSPYSWWPFGDQSYHFNRNLGGGTDSRMEHRYAHEHDAENACNMAAGHDNPEEAAAHLGVALHSAQDWVAHGDFFVKWEGPIIAAHNAYSRQPNIPPGVGKVGIVDNIDYDAVTHDGSIAPDGRAAGENVMYYYNTPAGPPTKRGDPSGSVGMLVDWAWFKYVGEANSLRAKKTKELTDADLKSFQDYVRASGGCKCKQYFGVQ